MYRALFCLFLSFGSVASPLWLKAADRVEEKTSLSMSLSMRLYLEAARTTWTSKQLETYGHTPVEIESIRFKPEGTISYVAVLFTKKSDDSAAVHATQ